MKRIVQMDTILFNSFMSSGDTLRIYKGNTLLFASSKSRLTPLLEYIDRFVPHQQDVTVFDRMVGNAAALLLKKALCRRGYSPLGSELAVNTLSSYGIEYHFAEVVPYIQNATGEDMCPMEKLSIGKRPDEFYEDLRRVDRG